MDNAVGTNQRSVRIFIEVSTLPDAVDAPLLPWTSGGEAAWLPQTLITNDGQEALQSGEIKDGETSWVETTVQGPGRISFQWKVACERGGDHLGLLLDGEEIAAIDRLTGFRQESFLLPAGRHALRWIYQKDSYGTSHEDCGWLDEVAFTPAPGAPVFVSSKLFHGCVQTGFSLQLATSPAATSYEITAGMLPADLVLNPVSGLISGSPAAAGEFGFTVSGSNDGGAGTQSLAGHIDSPFELWAANANLSGAAAAPYADPDGDGLPNLLAYALGATAGGPHFGIGPVIGQQAGEISATFDRSANILDIIYEVEASTDLVAWETLAKGGLGAPMQALGATPVTEEPVGNAYRVRIQRPPNATA